MHLLPFQVCSVLPAPRTIFSKFKPGGSITTVFPRVIVSGLAFTADKHNEHALFLLGLSLSLWHYAYSIMLVTTPAPMVLPPSLMAKRIPSSMATGAISSALSSTSSPGKTISLPSGSLMVPVTSVVRM